MDASRVTGTAQDMAGRAQRAAGDFVGDARTQARGAYNQMAGQAENLSGQASDAIKAQPMAALLIAAGVGFLLGRLSP
jgi:uncharacterized protein YjbJ (UPF0337 family)